MTNQQNERRLQLIHLDTLFGLEGSERAELDELQELARRHADTVAPIDFGKLEQLERLAGITA